MGIFKGIMAKRLTDTEKWDDPWFRNLSPVMKCVWQFICDKCDNAGVWKKDFELMKFFIGSPIESESVLAVFNGAADKKRIVELGDDKWLICKFAAFQYKNNPKMFNHINSLCQKHELDMNTLFIGYQYPIDRTKDKNKVKDKVKNKVLKQVLTGFDFDILWNKYPNKLGKKEAERHFRASVMADQDYADIQRALNNYTEKIKGVDAKYIKHGSTWFNNWRDWIDYKEPNGKSQALKDLESMVRK